MINRILNTKEINYTSSLDKENLIIKLKSLFEQETIRLNGKFISENEFSAYENMNIIGWYMPNLRRKSTYLKGEISQQNNIILIKLKVISNPILPISAIIFMLGGSLITFIALLTIQKESFFLFFGPTLTALGFLYYLLSITLRNRVLKKIVKYLGLVKV